MLFAGDITIAIKIFYQVVDMAEVLGFKIIDCGIDEYIKRLLNDIENGGKKIIVSGNPEVLYNALHNDTLKSLCMQSDIIPDGIGVLIAGRITGQRFKQKIAGISIIEEILKRSRMNNIKIYLLGAEQWVVERAAEFCREKYNAIIAGFNNGFFDIDSCEHIIDEINKSGADVLLVAMGCPKQELFISKYKDQLECKILMGVGGSFDVISGKVKRAPNWMVNTGLEWLYRVLKEPFRIKRLASIPKFLFMVIKSGKKNG